MSRPPRIIPPEQPVHITHRGNDRMVIFRCDNDRQFYLQLLRDRSRDAHCQIHSWALMGNHLHLLASAASDTGISCMMRTTESIYATYFNRRYKRTGTLWEGRFWSSLIDSEPYFFCCSFYIEDNAKHAGLVSESLAYPWSSCRRNLLGVDDGLVTPHPLYLALGATAEERTDAYRQMHETAPDPAVVETIRLAIRTGLSISAALERIKLKNDLSRWL